MSPIGKDFAFGSLRSLSLGDVSGMLEWMHDESISDVFNANFLGFTEKDVEAFIQHSWEQTDSLHFAIQDDDGCYLGTVSLKDIDAKNLSAEYAISTRKAAQGTGFAMRGTIDVLSYAFEKLDLERVYLNVKATNHRAIRFYEKVGYVEEGIARKALRTDEGSFVDLIWLSMLKEDFEKRQR